MEVLTQKRESKVWIDKSDNSSVFNIIEEETPSFRERFEKGLTVEEFRAEMKRRIRSYPDRK